MANPSGAGEEALRRLKATHQPAFLAPNPALSETARAASRYLFSALRPFSPKSPLDQLLVDGFDAEQIWQQIDLQSQPLLSSLRRRVKQLAKNPEEISQLKVPLGNKAEKKEREEWEEESDGVDEELEEEDDEEGVEKEGKELEEGTEEEDEDDEEEEEEEEGRESGDEDDGEGEEEENGEGGGGIEDKFLKIDELTKFLEKEEENFENGEVDKKGEEDSDDEEDADDDEESDEVRVLFA